MSSSVPVFKLFTPGKRFHSNAYGFNNGYYQREHPILRREPRMTVDIICSSKCKITFKSHSQNFYFQLHSSNGRHSWVYRELGKRLVVLALYTDCFRGRQRLGHADITWQSAWFSPKFLHHRNICRIHILKSKLMNDIGWNTGLSSYVSALNFIAQRHISLPHHTPVPEAFRVQGHGY